MPHKTNRKQYKKKESILDLRDRYRENASELEKNVATVQTAKYETVLYRLMARTQDNAELINAINDFLGALDHRSRFGDEMQPLGKGNTEDLTSFFKEKSEKLRFISGNKPSPEKTL